MTSPRRRSSTHRPASRGRPSSRSPRASATSTRGSTCARRTSRRARSGPAGTGSRRRCGPTATSTGMAPVADQLAADVRELQAKVPTAEMSVASVGNGAKELLDEVATGKITGEEEAFSHTDLVDFQANLDGARKAYDVLRPLVVDAELLATLDAAFTAVQDELDKHREGTGFVSYETVDEARPPRAEPGRRRPQRAAVPADGRRGVSTPGGLSRRHLLAGAGALGAVGVAGGLAAAATAGDGPGAQRPGRVPRRPPGRHRDAGAGSPALRVVRRHDDRPGRPRRPAPGLDGGSARHDGEPAGRRRRPAQPPRTAVRHRRGGRPGRREPHPHGRPRAVVVRRPLRARRAATRRRSSTCRGSPATRWTRLGATATWRSRPAPTTRRSRCTPCAT